MDPSGFYYYAGCRNGNTILPNSILLNAKVLNVILPSAVQLDLVAPFSMPEGTGSAERNSDQCYKTFRAVIYR
jgi:hypothetical protein